MEIPIKFPTITLGYAVIYLANVLPPPKTNYIISEPDLKVNFETGPIEFSYQIPVKNLQPPMAIGQLLGIRMRLPEGCYLIAKVEKEVEMTDIVGFEQFARLRLAEVMGSIDLIYPGLIDQKIYEGTVDIPNPKYRTISWSSEKPIELIAQPVIDHEDIKTNICCCMSKLDKLCLENRERYRLASRWFRRGYDATNLIDKFLFWFIVLEIYPTMGKTKVPDITSEFIKKNIYHNIDKYEIKKRIKIGKIYGKRNKIVHDGKSFIESGERQEFLNYLDILQAIDITCLRILAGLSPGHELDKYVRSIYNRV